MRFNTPPCLGHHGSNARKMVAIFRIQKIVQRDNNTMAGMVGINIALGIHTENSIAIRRLFEYIHALLSCDQFRSPANRKIGMLICRTAHKLERWHLGQRQMLIPVLSTHITTVQFQIQTLIQTPPQMHLQTQKSRGNTIGSINRQKLGKIDLSGIARGNLGIKLVPISAQNKIDARLQIVKKDLEAQARFGLEIDIAHLKSVRSQMRSIVIKLFNSRLPLRPA